jgi:hypothetical protein
LDIVYDIPSLRMLTHVTCPVCWWCPRVTRWMLTHVTCPVCWWCPHVTRWMLTHVTCPVCWWCPHVIRWHQSVLHSLDPLTCLYVCMCVCMYVCMYDVNHMVFTAQLRSDELPMCIYVCMYVCMYVCAMVWIIHNICIHVSNHMCMCDHTQDEYYTGTFKVNTRVQHEMHVCNMNCTCATRTNTCIHVCMYACMHVCVYVCMYVCMYVCIYVCM